MTNDDVLWEQVCLLFPLLRDDNKEESEYADVKNYKMVIQKLGEAGLDYFLEELIITKITDNMRQHIAPKFWCVFYCSDHDPENDFIRFRDAVGELNRNYLSYLPTMQRLEEMRILLGRKEPILGESNLLAVLKLIIRTVLHSQLPIPKHQSIIEEFYKLSFKVFYNADKTNRAIPFSDFNESGEDDRCGGCSGIEQCRCDSIINDFHTTNRILIQLELLERLAGEVLTSLIHKQIENHVQETCKDTFNQSFIAPLEKWLDTVVVGWLTRLYSSGPESPSLKEKLNIFKQKLQHLLYETYTRLRIDQLFTIIIDYPESEAAVEDLRLCLDKTDLHNYLIEGLQAALKQRLLHPGVNTPDIITAYVHSIRALRGLDPSGLLLDTVTHPVRQYLRCREDTMRCVVMSLTDEGPDGDLADELARSEEVKEESEENWETWTPPHIDTVVKTTKETKQSWDIISMLVTVYGSKETFVHEYRNLLADRLLTQYSYNTEKEIRYLELLKLRRILPQDWRIFMKNQQVIGLKNCIVVLDAATKLIDISTHLNNKRILPQDWRIFMKNQQVIGLKNCIVVLDAATKLIDISTHLNNKFGDSQLHYCEVMLKDIHDSKRINTHLHSEPNFGLSKQEFRCTCMILSAQFWPPFKEETLQLPKKIKDHLDVYTKAFETLKGNRTLNWKPHLGSVSIEIELKHRTINLNVSPTQAAIIWHFQDKNEWSIEELSGVLHIPPTLLRRRIAFWQSQGLLKESATDTYCLIEETGGGRGGKGMPDVCEDEEVESITASAQDQREEELQVFWSYIDGMLTNLDSLPLERIHQMLKMFAAQGVDCSLQQLRHFLDRKVREHKLLFTGGYYRLPK